ncbi:MAG: RsiG family protein [Acidimicrobiales bacterium]
MSDDAKLERILADDYLDDLSGLSMERLREMRKECQEIEVTLSYIRRLLHAKLDILQRYLDQRAEGGGGDIALLLEQMPEILAVPSRPPGPGRLPVYLSPDTESDEPADVYPEELRGEVAVAMQTVEDPELSEVEDLKTLIESLKVTESRVSSQRREIHTRIDTLQMEIVSRYRSGLANVDALLR